MPPLPAADGGVLVPVDRLAAALLDPTFEREGFFGGFAARLRTDPRWRVFEVATGHNGQYTMPKELSELLAKLM